MTRSAIGAVALLTAGIMGLWAGPARANVLQTFDQGPEDFQAWMVNNGGGLSMAAPVWHAAGGNDGGYTGAAVGTGNNRLYGFQPATADAYGDLTGLLLTADTWLQGVVNAPAGAKVRFYVGSYTGGNNYFVTNDLFSWDPNMDMNWIRHQVPLVVENFLRWPNCDAYDKTFEQVLAQVDDIGLIFAGPSDKFNSNAHLGFKSGHGATLNLDNFGAVNLIPEPATLASMVLGGAILLMRRTPARR